MNNLILRPAALGDLPTLYEFEQGIVDAERPYDPTLKPDHINYYDLKDFIRSDQVEVIVATINDLIIGSGYAKIKAASEYLQFDEYAYVGFMFVRPAYRGQGVSQKILEYERYGYKRHMVEMRIGI